MKKQILFLIVLGLLVSLSVNSQDFKPKRSKKYNITDTIVKKINTGDLIFEIEVTKGKYHNYPSFAIWIESVDEKFIVELFVTKSVATGIYRYGDKSTGQWTAGERRYAAALPYFFHRKNPEGYVPDKSNPILDAYTGATPQGNFLLKTESNSKILKGKIRLLLEVNQTWDYNNYWHNAKFPGDVDYKTSCQPSVVYAVTIDLDNLLSEYYLNPIGHGHYSGKDGFLYTDLSTLTTALQIFDRIKVRVVKK